MKKKTVIIGFILTLIYSIRLLYLDSDGLAFGLGQISSFDEGYYNELGIQISREAFITILKNGLQDPHVANARTFFISNVLVGISLKIFGNNYWGLRIPYVLMGWISGFFLYLLVRKIVPQSYLIHLFVLIQYVFDFNIWILSRGAVTVVPCMLASTIMAWGFISIKENRKRWLFLGFVGVCSLTLVYMGLPFLLILTGEFLLFPVVMKRTFLKECFTPVNNESGLYLAFGIIGGGAISEVLYRLFYRVSLYKALRDTLLAHAEKISFVYLGTLIRNRNSVIEATSNTSPSIPSSSNLTDTVGDGVIRSLFGYWTSNVFRYNPLLLILTIISFICLIHMIIVYKDKISLFLFLFIGTHILQTVFISTNTASKSAITYPIVLLAIAYAMDNCIGKKRISEKRIMQYFLVSIIISTGLFLRQNEELSVVRNGVRVSYIITMIAILLCLISKDRRYLILSYAGSLIVMCVFIYNMILHNPTYTFRDMMIDLGETTENGALVEGAGANLYNYCTTPVAFYDHYKGAGHDFDTMYQSFVEACYSIDDLYILSGGIDEWNERIQSTPFEFIALKKYPLEYYKYTPHDSDMILYIKSHGSK